MTNPLARLRWRFIQPALVMALGIVAATATDAAVTDIANAPLSSASNLAVKPNLMFILDDSGSMTFDALPDNAEPQQGASERKFWDQVWNCKWRVGSGGLRANHCDRVDPPFGAVEFNGLYYNPQQTYRPPLKADGSSFTAQTNFSSVQCDPYNGHNCSDFYTIGGNGTAGDPNSFLSYYVNGKAIATATSPTQTYTNTGVTQWYGNGSTFDVQNKFPEIVYCTSANGNVGDATQCRRNGQSDASDPAQTGNPFRYSSAVGPSVQTPTNALTRHNGYPESFPPSEFWRPSTGGTITVTTASSHGIPSAATPCVSESSAPIACRIIPRTGNVGFDTTGTNNPVAISVTGPNQFTYSNGTSGQALFSGLPDSGAPAYDLVVRVVKQNATTVRVSLAFNHGLVSGDRVNLTQIACNGCAAREGFNVADQPITFVNANTFDLPITLSGTPQGTAFYRKSSLFNVPKLRAGSPFYYTIEPAEFCRDEAFTDCKAAAAPTSDGYLLAAPVRFCLTEFDANRLDSFPKPAPSTTPPTTDLARGTEGFTSPLARCQKKYHQFVTPATGPGFSYEGYIHPRYGQFRRTDITSASTFSGRSLRTDCVGAPTCSLSEETTNFANWFAYYRHRILMMKTSTGIAFGPIDGRYRVGFITINPGTPVDAAQYLKIDDFTAAQKASWYTTLYAQDPGGGTPLPTALSRVGRYFAGKHDGINRGMDDDPVQYSCQQNFALLTTDGFWSGFDGKSIKDTSTGSGDSIGNQDNVLNCSATDPRSVCRGVWDGYTTPPAKAPAPNDDTSTVGTLADVALYYYNTDLRGNGSIGALGKDVSIDNVPTSDKDKAFWQHMTTFGLGMAEGLMNWRKDYESASEGDFFKIKTGQTGCSWDPSCRWPVPGSRRPENLDDLWHAAVNGRGLFFYARDTLAVQQGLQDALTNLNQRNAAGTAAATSTPNITPSDRFIFKTSYTTILWDGQITAQQIDPNTGAVLPTVVWTAQGTLQGMVGPSSDKRTIYTFTPDTSTRLKNFLYANLTDQEKKFFDNQCAALSQCASLDPTTQVPAANSGQNLVNFLRGQTQFEATLYRDRQFALGDTINATPLFIGKPRLAFVDKVAPTYAQWAARSAIQNRTPALYVGANDGMLHAFNANTGQELWAYVPRMLMPNLFRLAESAYATNHVFYVDGAPATMDIFANGDWHTILVGGLNSGGRGYYALDVTDPLAPQALWEFCSDASLCPVSDPNLGLTYGNPVITKRASDGRWVVLLTSGYNNVNPGDGVGHLYVLDAFTGQLLQTPAATTGVGSTTSPSGLGKINVWVDNFTSDNTALAAYGGDLQGNIFKFDLNVSPVTVTKIAQALDGTNRAQPITTKPELGLVLNTYKVLFVGTGRYLGVSDLTDPATQTPPGTDAFQQSIYAFKITPDAGAKDTLYGNLRNPANLLVQQTITQLSPTSRSLSSGSGANTPALNWSTNNGWYVDLNPGGASPGERVNIDPQLVLGTLVVATNVPGGDACSVGGEGWVYQFDYKTGLYVTTYPNQVLATKQTGALIVGLSIYQLQSGSIVGQLQRSETVMRQQDIYTQGAGPAARRASWREIAPHH